MKARTVPLDDAFWFQEGPGVRKWQFTTSGIKLLNVGNILSSGEIDLSKTDRFLGKDEVEKRYEHFLVDEGDLVIASSGISFDNDGLLRTRGAFIDRSHLPLCLNTSTIRFKSKEGADLRYLRFWLDSYEFRSQITRRVTGSAQQNFGPSHLQDIRITLPDFSEQKRISGMLEQADRLRQTRRYALELSATFLPAVFLELFGDLNTNTNGWESNAFDEVCTIDAPLVDPRKPEYRNLPHLGGDNIESVTGRILRFRTAAEDGLISSKFLIGPDHILFSKIRPKLRKVSEPKMVALCSADIYPIRPRSNTLKSSYLVGFLRSDYFSRIVSSLAESRTNIPKINREELSDIPVLLPPITEQKKFSALAKRHERMLASQREALHQADHLFQSLLDRAFR